MAPTQGHQSSNHVPGTMKKLPPIPNGAKVQKRPLIRRQPPSSSKSRTVFISSSTSFMSSVKRIRKLLDASLKNTTSAAPKNASMHSRVSALKQKAQSESPQGDGTVVRVMGTGRAVEKVLAVASWYDGQNDCEVEMRTGTVGTIDDIVVENADEEDQTRVRRLSSLELAIKLK